MIKTISPLKATLDANEAVASVAYRISEFFAIYPITPSSPMGEWVDEWSAAGKKNLWGHRPEVIEMQSEGGAAGALHGALQAGALASSFTASQGLLLMIPNLYKIAGELHPFVLHVTARSLATHALSIFCDHGDVMACRQTGSAMLFASNVQEAQDFALVSHVATLRSRVPFMNIFDGFRTSHEIQKISLLSDDDIAALLPQDKIAEFRKRALTPDAPSIRGTAQNPDVYFQAREAANPYYASVADIVQETFDDLAARTGRQYHLYDYEGAPDADRVIVVMGSGAETCAETAAALNAAGSGSKTGVLNVRLYRPLDAAALIAALPKTVRRIAVLDRTKEPGALGEPLFLDTIAAIAESPLAGNVTLIGGRYGLGSKEFTPAMAKAVFDELALTTPRRRFTVGINDDISGLSLPYDEHFSVETDDTRRAIFYGLGSDGTVGANKNSIKIIGGDTELNAQGFFVYDSKKSGAMTISHLRFGPKPIRAPYLITQADFVAVHHFPFAEKMEVLACARPGATLLLNTPGDATKAWDMLPREMQQRIIDLKLKVFAIDALTVARAAGMGGQINTVMQACFFALSNVIERDAAIAAIKAAIKKSYLRKGEAVVKKNWAAVDSALAALHTVEVPAAPTNPHGRPPTVSPAAPDFVQRITARMLAGEGDLLPVSAFTPDGGWPTGTAAWEKRNLAPDIPVWDASICIQCNKCATVCPHAAIRAAVYPNSALEGAPGTFKSVPFRSGATKDHAFTIQVAPDDCTGCSLCVKVCPAKSKTDPDHKALNMAVQAPLREAENTNFDFFLKLPPPPVEVLQDTVKGAQFRKPLFEFSGACAGCGETPYVKLLTQLFGDRLLIANATGCSSIYGGNLPTTPYCTDRHGRGPAWSNSLFEDNAEYGLGIRAGVDQLASQARQLFDELAAENKLPAGLVEAFRAADQKKEAGINDARTQVAALKPILADLAAAGGDADPRISRLAQLADYLVRKSVWILGGDGWAYDIGFGGLDHVLAIGTNVKVLVLDTEVYSNTGGQRSKSTPLGAIAKFSAAGKETEKKDLALMAATYGHVYVARVALGAKDSQTVQALLEAEAYDGPALIIAYSPCVAHGYALGDSLDHQKLAVDTGYWPLLRYNPLKAQQGQAPMTLDSPMPKESLDKFKASENRYQLLYRLHPDRAKKFAEQAQASVASNIEHYKQLTTPPPAPPAPGVVKEKTTTPPPAAVPAVPAK
ncbi:pyruvate-flavodoxin oxidoreductase [Opitutaceae bacterium TAV5]|nr:pyruvate-flavodoxin oxidoreductase [Opitutaceae bacterium TAV5]